MKNLQNCAIVSSKNEHDIGCKVEKYSRYTNNSICPNFGTLQDFLDAEFNALSRGNVLSFVSSTYFFENLKFVKKFSYQ